MKYFVIALMSIIVGFAISNQYFPKKQLVEKIDTITVIPAPIVIEKVKPKIVYRTDTIITTHPFVASVDTVYKTDTISIAYKYPENEMRMVIKMATDTIYHKDEAAIVNSKEQEWWTTPAIAVGGFLMGYFITNASK